MSLTFHALAMLCGLGAPAFAAVRVRPSWLGVGAVAVGFAAAIPWFGPERSPDAVWVGALVALAAAAQLVRRDAPIVAALMAGALAALWGSTLRVDGISWPVAVAVAAAPSLLSAYLATCRPRFAPTAVRDEALLAVLVVGLGVATAPGIQQGWRSAVQLNIQSQSAHDEMVPVWTFGLTGASLALGGLYSLWRRG